MDQTVDPCEDFYRFTCGNWEQEHPTPDSALEYNWFSDRTQHIMRQIRGKFWLFVRGEKCFGT
jgi:predicted metalloendopeptidase